MSLIVISHEQLDGARGVIDSDALPEFAVRGWVEVGPAVSPTDLRTVDEIAAEATGPDVEPEPAATTETSVEQTAEPPTEADAADADAATASTNKE